MTHETAQTREALVELMKKAAEEGEARYYETTPPDFADDDIKHGMIVDAQLLALEAAGVRLVPAEPTHDQMTHAMLHRSAAERPPHIYDTAGTYRVMLAASPYAKDKP